MVLMEKNNRLRADIAALEVERDGLSTNIEDLRQEIVQARRQYDAELDNHQHQWTGTLLERVRPHALEVRDHIVKLREKGRRRIVGFLLSLTTTRTGNLLVL